MDRRTLLVAMGALATSATPALGCSPMLRSPRYEGLVAETVRDVFDAWWNRDSVAFRKKFTERRMNDGSKMDLKLAEALRRSDPIPESSFAIFDRFFLTDDKVRRITMLVDTAVGMLVGCVEDTIPASDGSRVIEADCSGMPDFHLFLVGLSGVNVQTIAHIESARTVEADKVTVWTM